MLPVTSGSPPPHDRTCARFDLPRNPCHEADARSIPKCEVCSATPFRYGSLLQVQTRELNAADYKLYPWYDQSLFDFHSERMSVAAMFEPRERLWTVLWCWPPLGGSDERRRSFEASTRW